jgi:hypothetical protein
VYLGKDDIPELRTLPEKNRKNDYISNSLEAFKILNKKFTKNRENEHADYDLPFSCCSFPKIHN